MNSVCNDLFSFQQIIFFSQIYGTFRFDLDSNPNDENAIRRCADAIKAAFTGVSNSLQSIRTLSAQNNCPSSSVATSNGAVQDTVNCQDNEESVTNLQTNEYQCCESLFFSFFFTT